MFRKVCLLALVIVALHIAAVLTLGSSLAGSLAGNLLEITACGLAVAAAFSASRRTTGLSRRFWVLVGCGLAVWGVANVGWMYYEIALRIEPPTGSVVRFLFGIQSIFFALAVFLNQDKDSSTLDTESVLDFIQIAIVFFFIFLGFYYIPSHHLDARSAYIREVWMESGEDVALVLLALVQAMRARSAQIRRLYQGFAVYLLGYTVCAGIADYMQTLRTAPTGTWYDLGWTAPLLGAALWAANWQPSPPTAVRHRLRQKGFGELLLDNSTLALAPLIVLLQVAELGNEWRAVRFTLLGVSIVCYAARLGITQYRQTRTEDTLQRHNRAMDSAVNGMAIVDAEGRHTYANVAFARMMGHESAESIVGRGWRDIYAPQDVKRVEGEIRKSLRENGKWYGALNIHRRDGSGLPAEMAITSLPDGGVVCVSRDMTAKREADNARAQAEAKYRMLVEQVAAISYIAEVGFHGEWLYVSPQVETMFGFSAEEWLMDSRAWTQHVHPEDHKIVEDAEEASQRGERFQAEYRVIRKDGRVIWVSDTAVVVEGSGAHPLMEGIIVDITERKQLETQLQQARRMEAIGRLAGGIAHDFNNLLTIIKGYTELALRRPKISPELQADVERIEDASERASTLVRQLLAFSRRQVLQPKLLDLNSIVMGLDKLLRRLMDEGITMSTVPGNDIGTIKADPGQMEQVIMNLVVNARDAMPKGGRLTVETTNVELDAAYASDHVTVKPGRYVMLAVSDTGTGMSPETVAHIFEPFYTTKESGHGTGLGLSTVYGIVKQSGGYVWVYSEVGRGSSFKVYLPRVDEAPETLQVTKVTSGEQRGSETILLVEDQPQVRELARMTLSEKGYTVLVTSNPEDAETACARHDAEIHLLLTDLIMPGLTGLELAKRLTARHPKMRVLYMSGYTFGITTQPGMQGGLLEDGVPFLQKPFTPSVLSEKVREVLDRSVVTSRI
jgi:two-component system, cell cycle sensor histidine kinase and response regulator CckA